MEKAISFLILIIVGILFRSKIESKEQVNTIKTLILTLALPAVIFSALIKINLTPSLLYPPLIVLACNLLLFLSILLALPILMGKSLNLVDKRTLLLMLPSFAPYLSCFPFLAEYTNESTIGLAAIADTGNKIFILIFLYLLTMYWACQNQPIEKSSKSSKRIINTFMQPINLAIILAIVASWFGVNMETIPTYFQDSLSYLRNLLTPMILIFIGLAVKLKKMDIELVLGLLFWRSSVAFLLSALFISIFNFNSVATILLIVAFPQSSCSFIPYAQMTIFSELTSNKKKTFNHSLALSLLATSLPFSSLIIVSIYVSNSFFTVPVHLIAAGVVAFMGSFLLLKRVQSREARYLSIQERLLATTTEDTAQSAKPSTSDRIESHR